MATITRRTFIKGTAAVGGGVAASSYLFGGFETLAQSNGEVPSLGLDVHGPVSQLGLPRTLPPSLAVVAAFRARSHSVYRRRWPGQCRANSVVGSATGRFPPPTNLKAASPLAGATTSTSASSSVESSAVL